MKGEDMTRGRFWATVACWGAALGLGVAAGRAVGASRGEFPRNAAATVPPATRAVPAAPAVAPAAATPVPSSEKPRNSFDFPVPPKENVASLLLGFRSGLREEMRKEGGKCGPNARTFMKANWVKLEAGMIEDPATFASFVRASENEDLCAPLLGVMFFSGGWNGEANWSRPVHPLPAPIALAIKDLLESGTDAQRLAALQCTRTLFRSVGSTGQASGSTDVWGVRLPGELVGSGLAYLASGNPRLCATSLELLRWCGPEEIDRHLDVVLACAGVGAEPGVQRAALSILGQVQGGAAAERFQESMSREIARAAEKGDLRALNSLLGIFEESTKSAQPERLAGSAAILMSAIRVEAEPKAFVRCVEAALQLPVAQAREVLEKASLSAPTAALQKSACRALDLMREGETRADRILSAFHE